MSQLPLTLELKLSDHIPFFQVTLSGPPSDLHTNVDCWLNLGSTQKTKPFRVCDSCSDTNMTAEKITYLQLRLHVMCVCFVDHFSGRFEPHRFERLTNKPTPEEMPQNLNANSVSGIDNWLKLASFNVQ